MINPLISFDKILKGIAMAVAILVLQPAMVFGVATQDNAAKPNVVIILTDDQGYGELSCHGNLVLQTPNLDQLHDRSIRFTDFHSSPMCTPSRGQLMTGLDAARNGAVNVSSGRSLLRPEVQTMADIFAANGYQTGIFGKWHLGDNYPYRPQDRGFSKSLWFPSSHISSVPDYWGNDYNDDTYIHNGERKKYEGYCTDIFFQKAMEWALKCRKEGDPFLLYLPTNAPHYPFFAPDEDLQEMEKAFSQSRFAGMEKGLQSRLVRYLAMIRNIDKNVGGMIDFMRREQIFDNTIFIFATDNGSIFGADYFNAGMRGRKAELYEGGHRVPFFISWPAGKFASPRDIDDLAHFQDVLPTLIELCGLKTDKRVRFDGISLAPVLRGEKNLHRDRMLAIHFSRMPMGFEYPSGESPSVMHREGAAILWRKWRLLGGRELYDLANDPMQERNIIEQHPEVAGRMNAYLDEWWRGVKDIANEPQRTMIGSDRENPILLTACEWMDVFVDQQGQVRNGSRKNSYWLLQVDQPGEYEFELRRWPKELDLPLSGAPAGGKVLPVAIARLWINGARHFDVEKPMAFNGEQVKVSPEDKMAVFTVDLEKGPVALHTWFDDAANNTLCGAYYVYVRRK